MGVLTEKIEAANALGIANLTDKGVSVGEDATTYQIMSAIGDISGGEEYAKYLTQISFYGNTNMPETIEVDCSNIVNLSYCFESARGIKTVSLKNTQNVVNMTRFLFNSLIETIGVLDLSGIKTNGGFTTPFSTAPNLTNIEFKANTIPATVVFNSKVLTANSIQNIIDGLATVSTTQTLTLPSIYALTDEQKATISAKGWTLAQ